MNTITKGDVTSGAIFSPCMAYRYALWRRWNFAGRFVAFIGLNPSTADEKQNDPTVTRCINYAKSWGYGGMTMLNAYAYRSTDPKGLRAVSDPTGPWNVESINDFTNDSDCSLVVCCWGTHCKPDDAAIILDQFDRPMCLGTNKDGSPKHPLYLPAHIRPVPFGKGNNSEWTY